jgi:lipoyl-dependent peroxiredoxin
MASTSHVKWTGSTMEGSGHIDTGTGAFSGDYTASGRFGDGAGTNPEELMAASHASCFTMALSLILGQGGHDPESLETDAKVYLRKQGEGYEIHKIELETVGTVPGVDEAGFKEAAEAAKANCPVSKALAGVGEISLTARLA